LLGKKLKGSFVLVRTRDRQWLLIKHRDEYATEGEDITETQPYSVLTKRTFAEIAEDEGGNIKKAATGIRKASSSPRHQATEEDRQEENWHTTRRG